MTEPLLLLEDGRHRVQIAPELGGGLAAAEALAENGPVPILRPWEGIEAGIFGLGQNTLVPFSNRISSGGFRYGGTFHAVAPNLGGEPFPIHGDGFQKEWTTVEATGTSAVLRLECGRIGPYAYVAELLYELDGTGLNCTLRMINQGIELPFGGGFHPWFPRYPDTQVRFHAAGVWLEDERHLPTRHLDLSDHPDWAFVELRALPSSWVNNAFSGWDGTATITHPGLEIEVRISAQDPLNVAILYSPDGDANFFCFEPVSHSVDAHNQPGQPGLVPLKAGDSLELAMKISWAWLR